MSTTLASSAQDGALPRTGVDSLAAWATLFFLGLTAGVQMTDRGLLAMLSSAIQTTYQAGDGWIGALHGVAGILVASLLALPLAKLADRHSRKLMLLGFIAAWALLTLLAAAAPNFPLFFMGRAAAGITEFALIPVIYSMIPDLVSEKRRVLANLIFAALMAAGASAGYYFGGATIQLAGHLVQEVPAIFGGFEAWRVAMALLAMLGLPLLLLGLTTHDPPRAMAQQESAASSGSLLDYARSNAAALALLILAAGGVAMAVQGLMPLIVLALTRRFETDLGPVGESLGMLLLATNLTSLVIAGFIDRLLLPRIQQRGRPLVMALGALATVPFVLLMLQASTANVALVLIGGFLLMTCIANALIPTIIQDIVPNKLRARAFAVYSLIISVFCAAGPVLMGGLSDLVLRKDLLTAIVAIGTPSLLIAAACAAFATRVYPKTA